MTHQKAVYLSGAIGILIAPYQVSAGVRPPHPGLRGAKDIALREDTPSIPHKPVDFGTRLLREESDDFALRADPVGLRVYSIRSIDRCDHSPIQ